MYSFAICRQRALAERDQLQQQNHQLQHKLAEYFRKKKSDETRQDPDKNIADQEQRYLKYMGEVLLKHTRPVNYETVFHPVGPQNLHGLPWKVLCTILTYITSF